MSEIEILAYSPNDIDEFIAFCIEGKPDGNGGHQTDARGREIRGVLSWLHGREVPEAHFFNSTKNDDTQLFIAMIQRTETEAVPWMDTIPGFQSVINVEGLIGTTTTFPPISEVLAAVVPNKELDERFAQGKANLETVLERLEQEPAGIGVTRAEILAALKGGRSNSRAVLDKVQSVFGISL